MEIKYLFIDGACLRELLKYYSTEFFNNTKIDFEYSRLATIYQKIFYYDSLPYKKNDELDEDYEKRIKYDVIFLNELSLLNGFHVYEGSTRKRRRGIEQKKVDIMIAVDMLTHSFRKNMSLATLLTGDLDFKPLVDALIENGMYINLWYPVNKTSYELIQSADSSSQLDLETIYDYSSAKFKREYLIPTKKRIRGKDFFNSHKTNDIKNKYGIEGELYYDGNRGLYTLIFPADEDQKAFNHLIFNDKILLLKYFDEYSHIY